MQRVLLFLAALSTAACSVLLPRIPPSNQWQITNFAVNGPPDGSMSYSLDVTNDYIGAKCTAQTPYNVGGPCPSAPAPTAFANTTCSTTFWSWEFIEANSSSSTEPPQQRGFILKLAYTTPDASSAYGCRFIPYNVQCTADPENPAHSTSTLVVPSNFTITGQDSDCTFQ